jgi:hypothetical protein
MKIQNSIRTLALMILAQCLLTGWQKSARATELFSRSIQSPRPSEIKPKKTVESENVSPRISFERTVCDLGDVGQGTKNECEFRFTNTGRGLLKIDKLSRTCGCTVFHLDKKQYPPKKQGFPKRHILRLGATNRNNKSNLHSRQLHRPWNICFYWSKSICVGRSRSPTFLK